MSKKVSAEYAFLVGYKPAVITRPSFRHFSYMIEHFPYVDQGDSYQNHIFFQEEWMKGQYIDEIQYISAEGLNPDYARVIGKYLGYPPQSIDYYCRYLMSEDEKGKIGIYYAGINFSSHIDLLYNEIQWLQRTYRHPISMELPHYIRIGLTDVLLPNTDDTNRIEQHIQEALMKIPVIQ
jgi:hypothetical protein